MTMRQAKSVSYTHLDVYKRQALKIVMAITGLYFVFFVLFHMYGNLKILFSGVAGYDDYAHHLRTMFEPILPHSGFLWLFRLSLLLAICLLYTSRCV